MNKKITSRQNETVKLFRSLFNEKKARIKNNLFVCDNIKHLYEAEKCNLKPKIVMVTEHSLKLYPKLLSYSPIVIKEELSEYISDVKTPQGTFFAFEHLLVKKITDFSNNTNNNKIILLDNIKNPENAGSIIRTAAAFGITNVFFTDDCTDIFSPKAIRASAGALFYISCYVAEKNLLYKIIKELGYTIYASILDKNALSLCSFEFDKKSCIVFGNEGVGLSKKSLCYAEKSIYIPISGVQSLSVSAAAAILIFELSKSNL